MPAGPLSNSVPVHTCLHVYTVLSDCTRGTVAAVNPLCPRYASGLRVAAMHRDSGRSRHVVVVSGGARDVTGCGLQMESMNVKIYKQLQLTRDQKEHFREFWDAWEYRKRSIDKTMQVVRAKLRNLPYGIALPMPFLNRVNSLASQAIGTLRGGSGGWDGVQAAPAAAVMPPLAEDDEAEFDQLRLVGMTPDETEVAAKCLRELRAVHMADVEAFVDFKEVQVLPVSTLQTRQMVCMWSAHVLHKAAPHDFFGIARLASSQLQRESLYRLQTYA